MSLKTHTSSDNDALKIILNMCPILPNPIPSTIPQKLIPVLTNQISIFPYQESSGSNQPFLHSIHILANFAVDTETWLIDKTDLESFIDNLISVLSILLQNAAKGNSETYLFPMESTVVHGLPFTDAILPFFVLFNGLATLSKTFLKCRLFPALSDKNESSKSLQEYLTVLILHAGHSRVREQVEELVFYLFDESGKSFIVPSLY